MSYSDIAEEVTRAVDNLSLSVDAGSSEVLQLYGKQMAKNLYALDEALKHLSYLVHRVDQD